MHSITISPVIIGISAKAVQATLVARTLQSLKIFFPKTAVRSCWTFFFSIPNIHREDREASLYIQVIGQ